MVIKKDNIVLLILSGIPCSGKSTWVNKHMEELSISYGKPVIVLSKDLIRIQEYGREDWKWDNEIEKIVNKKYFKQLSFAVTLKSALIILDNTHCYKASIDKYLNIFAPNIESGAVTMRIKFFDVPLWKAKLRNYWRKHQTGKFVPIKELEANFKEYQEIDKKQYAKYTETEYADTVFDPTAEQD